MKSKDSACVKKENPSLQLLKNNEKNEVFEKIEVAEFMDGKIDFNDYKNLNNVESSNHQRSKQEIKRASASQKEFKKNERSSSECKPNQARTAFNPQLREESFKQHSLGKTNKSSKVVKSKTSYNLESLNLKQFYPEGYIFEEMQYQ